MKFVLIILLMPKILSGTALTTIEVSSAKQCIEMSKKIEAELLVDGKYYNKIKTYCIEKGAEE